MPTVADLLKDKGSQVFTVDAEATVLDAARLMNERRIGALVVTQGGKGAGTVAGIFTERDILTRVVAGQRDPKATKIREVMTADPMVCSTKSGLDQLRAVMREKRIRHIPIVDDGALKGMVSIGDLNHVEAKVLEETILYLEQYSIRT